MNQLDSKYAGYSKNEMDHFDLLDYQLKNCAMSSAGLAIGSTSKAKVKIANTVSYLINGVFKSKTTAEVAFTATTHDIEADADEAREACYLLSLDASGTATITMGEVAGPGLSTVPATPANQAAIGYVKLSVAAGSTDFDASTDLLDAAHITDTYVDLGYRGARFDTTATI